MLSQHAHFVDAQRHYDQVRSEIYALAQARIQSLLGFQCELRGINHETALRATGWTAERIRTSSPTLGVNWLKAYYHYNRIPSRFEVSVWLGGTLRGLSFGRMTRAKRFVKLEIIEGAPKSLLTDEERKIRAFDAISVTAQVYALAYDAEEIRIMQPINHEVTALYGAGGYEFVPARGPRKPAYCVMKLG